MHEKPGDAAVFLTLERLTKLAPKNGVNEFSLVGEGKMQLTDYEILFAVYPSTYLEEENKLIIFTLSAQARFNLRDYLKRIWQLPLPEHLKEQEDNDYVRSIFEPRLADGGLPFILLGFGKTKNRQEVVKLYAAWGIAPLTALVEISNKTRPEVVQDGFSLN